MSVSQDIMRSYRWPGQVIREKLAQGPREDRALVYLMLACLLIFVAQWPRLARDAHLSQLDLQPMIGAALLGWLFIAPLVFYVIAALQRLVARLFGGKGSGYGARLALFWALLVAAPVWLLFGLVQGFVAEPAAEAAIGLLLMAVFFLVWIAGIRASEGAGG